VSFPPVSFLIKKKTHYAKVCTEEPKDESYAVTSP